MVGVGFLIFSTVAYGYFLPLINKHIIKTNQTTKEILEPTPIAAQLTPTPDIPKPTPTPIPTTTFVSIPRVQITAIPTATPTPTIATSTTSTSTTASSTTSSVLLPTALTGTTFVHPGVLVNQGQLNFVKGKIAAAQEPWKTAYNNAKNSTYGSLQYTAHPIAIVSCGPNYVPDLGCTDEINDATAAYTQALLWYYSGDVAYARKSIEIMNAWSATLQDHTELSGPLQAAWAAELMVRGAEIIKHTSTEWTQSDKERFTTMVNNVFLAKFTNPTSVDNFASFNGNWDLSAIDAMIQIAVFTDNRTLFDQTLNKWRLRVPAYLYLTSDNNGNGLPIPPPGGKKNSPSALACFWLDNSTNCWTVTNLQFVDGHAQETCRDMVHTSMGIGSMISAAETARLQGVDLYGEEQERIVKGLEYNIQFINGTPYPQGFCNGKTMVEARKRATYEIAYNHYATRQHLSLPNTQIAVNYWRSIGGTPPQLQFAWETLTHGSTGNADSQ